MVKTTGREGQREWTQYGFRLDRKNHALVIQRNLPRVWWYTYHLMGRGQNDPIRTIKEAPLSRKQAEIFAREYIGELIK